MNLLSDNKDYYLKINDELFVSLHSVEGGSIGIVISPDDIDKDKLSSFFKNACEFLKKEKNSLVLKTIGGQLLLDKIKSIISSDSFSDKKYVLRENSFEVIYNPQTKLLRASKSVKESQEVKAESEEKKVVTKPKLFEAPIKKDVKVLIVDDSKTIRNLLTKIFSSDKDITVVATAEKPSDVEALILEHRPDVITLDIHMPEMNGVELLKILQPKYNIPTVMITSVSMEEGPLVLEALESGAFDYIQKPEMSELAIVAPLFIEKVKGASQFRSQTVNKVKGQKVFTKFDTNSLVVIGSSTGGTNALKDIFVQLPNEIPPTLVVQHIPAVFSKAFADRMNGLCDFSVKEASHGEKVVKNTVYIAPGGNQMKIVERGNDLFIEINDDAPVNRFKPSVDYMFKSIVPLTSKYHVVGVMLTGMGRDGAREMKALFDNGALTIAQNEESCVVYGMPREAVLAGGVCVETHLSDIPAKMVEFSTRKKVKAS